MSVSRLLRPSLDWFCRTSGLLRSFERRMAAGATILTHHRVLDDADWQALPLSGLAMPRSAFEAEVEWLARHCRVMTASEAVAALRRGDVSDRPIVCLTFDDGYDDNFSIVAPILEAADVRGTFFVTVGAVEGRQLLWFDEVSLLWNLVNRQTWRDLARERIPSSDPSHVDLRTWLNWLKVDLPRRLPVLLEQLGSPSVPATEAARHRMMTIGQVTDLARRGHEIGSHSRTHPLLDQLGDEELSDEVIATRQTLASWLGDAPPGFCYPNGNCSGTVAAKVRKAHYDYACTTSPGLNLQSTDSLQLHRIDMTPRFLLTRDGRLNILGLRSEISLLRHSLRAWRATVRR